MKRLWLTLLAVGLTAMAGSAAAAMPRHWQTVAEPNAATGGYAFRSVDWHGHGHGDWHGHWHGHRHWDDNDEGFGGSSLYFGFGNVWAPGWGPYGTLPPSYYYYYNPPVVVTPAPAQPSVYISRDQQNRPYYWYYCKSAHRYYPYVKQCPGGWLKVVPHPPKN